MDVFLHGIETTEHDEGNPRFVATIDSAIMFLVGTAPAASDELFPYDEPRVIRGYDDMPVGLGSTGTLPLQLEYALAQSGRSSPTIYFVRVEEVLDGGGDLDMAATVAKILGSRAAKTGLHAISRIQPEFGDRPKLIGAPGFTSYRPTDGVASIAVDAEGAGYLIDEPPAVTITRAGGDTTGFGAEAVAVVDTDGSISAIVVTNPGQGYTLPPLVTIAAPPAGGTQATALATLGTVGNPVTAALSSLCNRYRACAVVSGPNTTDEAAVTYRLDWDTDRIMVVDPYVKVQQGASVVSAPADAMVLGLQARIDYERGFWWGPSNNVIEGVLGTHRSIEHSLSDRSAQSQYLNRNHVSTVVRSPTGGWKLWGNRSADSDPLRVFWATRRAHDVIIESVELAAEVYLARPFSRQLLVDIAETVNRALRRWQAFGATLGGKVWLDPAFNTRESLSAGLLYVSYDGEAPAPLEHLVFRFHRNTGYYETMLASAAREIARLSSAGVAWSPDPRL